MRRGAGTGPSRVLRTLFGGVLLGVLSFLSPGVLAAPPVHFSVAVIGPARDPRVLAVREAVAHWNRELADLGAAIRFGPVEQRDGPRIPEDVLRGISEGTLRSSWPRPRIDLRVYGADVVVILAGSDLISIGHPPWHGHPGLVILREADDPPLSLPNVARNVAAHELGHVLGLEHTSDPATLMCGRPAPCRPRLFQSDEIRWFPLTAEEESYLRRRWQ